MTDIRVLNVEEIIECYPTGWLVSEVEETDRNIANAQYQRDIKAFIEWMGEMCYDWQFDGVTRAECPHCEESLKRLVKE